MKIKEPRNKSPQIKIGIGPLAFSCIAFGFIIFIGADYIVSLVENTDFSLLTTLIKGISSIAVNLIVIAFISLLIELTSIKDYIHFMVNQVITDVEQLIANKYSWDYSRLEIGELKEHFDVLLQELTKKERELQNIHIGSDRDEILKMAKQFLPSLMNDLICGEYYEDYSINLRLSIENQTYVKYIVTTSYLVTNSTSKTFKFYAVYPTEKAYKSLHFEHVKIYSKDRKEQYCDLTGKVNENIKLVGTKDKQSHHNIYCVESIVDFSHLTSNDYYVEYTRTYSKYIKNGVFVHSIPKPTKDFQAEIILENDRSNKYKIYGLSFYPYKQVSTQQNLRMKEQNHGPHSLTIHNANWCLPGTGFCIMLMENMDMLEKDI